jgi:hypothetical protein
MAGIVGTVIYKRRRGHVYAIFNDAAGGYYTDSAKTKRYFFNSAKTKRYVTSGD